MSKGVLPRLVESLFFKAPRAVTSTTSPASLFAVRSQSRASTASTSPTDLVAWWSLHERPRGCSLPWLPSKPFAATQRPSSSASEPIFRRNFLTSPTAAVSRRRNLDDISRCLARHQQRLYSSDRPSSESGKLANDAESRGSPARRPDDAVAKNTEAESSRSVTGDGKTDGQGPEGEWISGTMSKYLHLPKMPHRPTKEELLAAANGFWQRLRIRFKWASIRSMRPWNADEWGAFVSWFMLGHLVWILVGTTTFFSLVILSINTVFAQETLAKWVGDYLTQSAGIAVVFESAIVPKWKGGVISFRNVFVSRRPGQVKSSVSKGSSDLAAVAAAGRQAQLGGAAGDVDDGNYTQFDVSIADVNVTLSFLNWWNGKGLLKDVEVKGVRGVVDRTSVKYPVEHIDPMSYRHSHMTGDFEIETFKLEDLLLTIHQPKGFRPFAVSIYSCELPQLRKQWLFYDFLSANHMSGSFDGSLFTIHPRQVHGIAGKVDHGAMLDLGEAQAWKKFSRLRIDGLKIDHLNRGVEGTFGWIYEGNVDINADIMLPAENDNGITKVMVDFYDQLEDAVIANKHRFMRNINYEGPEFLSSGHLSDASAAAEQQQQQDDPPAETTAMSDDDRRYLIMDLRIHLNDVKAAVPLFTREMSYVNQALVRPIVAYINAKRTYIPITSRIVKRASDFDGSWTVFDCGLMNDMSAETYEAFARDVVDQQSRVRRFRKVGFWTLSLAVHALFVGMAGNVV